MVYETATKNEKPGRNIQWSTRPNRRMEQITEQDLCRTDESKEQSMVNVGVDLHKTQFTVCVRSRDGNSYAQYPTSSSGYELFLKEMSKRQEAGETVRVGVESTGNTRYFKNQMEAAGIEVTVVNPLKFKVVNESVKKTDKYDAATIAEFLEKDMLPVSRLCSQTSEQLRRLLKVRTVLVRSQVVIKNQIHALLMSEGLEDVKAGALQSKKGRKQTLSALNQWDNGLVAQPLFETIEQLEENVKSIEKQLRTMTKEDRMVELLMTIPGCGEICAWTIRAYADDISRFSSSKKFVSFAGLAPWVQNSNETIHHGKITKRGPKELRTALVQVVMGLRRMKEKTLSWRLTRRYEMMKAAKGSGKSIIAAARKIAVIIWHMLTEDAEFDLSRMLDKRLIKKAEAMRELAKLETGESIHVHEIEEDEITEEKPRLTKTRVKKPGVAGKKNKKVS
jgi:transposase